MGVELMVLGGIQAGTAAMNYMDEKQAAKESLENADTAYKSQGKGQSVQTNQMQQAERSKDQVRKIMGNATMMKGQQDVAADHALTLSGFKSNYLQTKTAINQRKNQATANFVGSLAQAGSLMTTGLTGGPRGANNQVQYDPRYGGFGYLFGLWDR